MRSNMRYDDEKFMAIGFLLLFFGWGIWPPLVIIGIIMLFASFLSIDE